MLQLWHRYRLWKNTKHERFKKLTTIKTANQHSTHIDNSETFTQHQTISLWIKRHHHHHHHYQHHHHCHSHISRLAVSTVHWLDRRCTKYTTISALVCNSTIHICYSFTCTGWVKNWTVLDVCYSCICRHRKAPYITLFSSLYGVKLVFRMSPSLNILCIIPVK